VNLPTVPARRQEGRAVRFRCLSARAGRGLLAWPAPGGEARSSGDSLGDETHNTGGAAAADGERAARREAEALAARLARLQAVTAALSGARTPDEVAEAALSVGLSALGGASGAFLVEGAAGNEFAVLRVAGIAEEPLQSALGARPTPAGAAWQSASPLFIERAGDAEAGFPAFGAAMGPFGWAALMALPLSAEGRVLGMLLVGFAESRPFPGEERVLAAAVAGLCGQALDRARLFVAERVARAEAVAAQRRLSFLDALSGVLTETLDAGPMAERVVELAVPALGDWAALFTSGGELEPSLAAAAGQRSLGERARALLEADPAGRLRAASRGAPPAVLEAEPSAGRPLCAALVPLKSRGELFGVLVVASGDRAQRYGPHDLALLSDVARRTALALEHARLYEAAHQAAQAREDFMQVASHELRGPVTSFRLAVQLLAREVARGDTARLSDRVRGLLRQADRLSRLSGALLDVTRITAGRLALVKRELDLSALARQVVENHAEEAEAAGTAVTVEAEAGVTCQADPERIEQVLDNLLSNAVKYGRGAPVTIRVAGEVGHAVLAVTDRGIGISPEHQARIFGRFERAVPPRNYGGLGLGLWIVRSLVEAHGGVISVVSAPGRGSTFTVKLPRDGE